jgi:hypothetical protein
MCKAVAVGKVSKRTAYHKAFYWRNVAKRRASARLSRWRQRASAMGIDV